jgi:hypothetical protein
MLTRAPRLFGCVLPVLLPLALPCRLGADGGTDRVDLAKVRRDNVRTYRFTARIKANGGVLPFRAGDTITGTFAYDLNGKNQLSPDRIHGRYKSALNAFSFQLGKFHFTGAGDILVTVGAYKHAEHFQIVAFDLNQPDGWKMNHAGPSQTYGIVLQNAPARGVVPHGGIPKHVSLVPFVNTRELRLDFCNGVQFPGGRVNGRATVFATVEALEEVNR